MRKVSLVLNRNKQDIGILIRLYHLQKRMNFIKFVTGEWKPVNIKYYQSFLTYYIFIVK